MYNVDGFWFEDEQLAELARKEEEGVRFIKERTALDNPEIVLKLYNRLLDQQLFVTPVGTRFLIELQNFLYTAPSITKEEVTPIDTSVFLGMQEATKTNTSSKKNKAKKGEKDVAFYKKAFYAALVVAFIFGVSVLGMFVIAKVSNNNVNILNYREKIINEYTGWEQELKEEEIRLKEWEKELQEREAASTQSE